MNENNEILIYNSFLERLSPQVCKFLSERLYLVTDSQYNESYSSLKSEFDKIINIKSPNAEDKFTLTALAINLIVDLNNDKTSIDKDKIDYGLKI